MTKNIAIAVLVVWTGIACTAWYVERDRAETLDARLVVETYDLNKKLEAGERRLNYAFEVERQQTETVRDWMKRCRDLEGREAQVDSAPTRTRLRPGWDPLVGDVTVDGTAYHTDVAHVELWKYGVRVAEASVPVKADGSWAHEFKGVSVGVYEAHMKGKNGVVRVRPLVVGDER